jgi:hypothetical protein
VRHWRRNPGKIILADGFSKARDQAEISFSKTQTQSMVRNRILSEQDAVSQAREAKTARLRELRMEKEAEELAAAEASQSVKRTVKR